MTSTASSAPAKPDPILWQFTARVSADSVKTDLELTCNVCGAAICDIEDGDELAVLVEMAAAHWQEYRHP